jgi:manganese/zinc/iron transport system permease protein
MTDLSVHDWWVLLIGILVAISCSILGVFLILRRMAMLGDAVSHSVLLSLALAFLLTGSRSLQVMWPAAVLVGLLTAFIVQYLAQRGRATEDAAIGIGFTTFFALGVVLISTFAANVDLDQECVLYGELALAPFDRFKVGLLDLGPRAFVNLSAVFVLILLFLLFGLRRMRCICFDPLLAFSQGIKVNRWHYVFMSLVSILVVSAFESVGAILVIGLLVIPANFAYLFSRSLTEMLVIAPFFAIFSVVLGYFSAEAYDLSISAAIVSVMGGVFVCFWWLMLVLRSFQPQAKPQDPN